VEVVSVDGYSEEAIVSKVGNERARVLRSYWKSFVL